MRGVIEHIPEFYSVCKKLFKSLKKMEYFLLRQRLITCLYHILIIQKNFI